MAVSIGVARQAATHIPTYRYTSSDFQRQEAESLWTQTWQIAGREEDIPEVGDFLEYQIGDQSILVIRGRDSQIRGFPNACRHRGTALVSGQGNVAELRCSFHAWCWEIEGHCAEIIDPHDFGDPELSDFDLPPYQIGVWAGFVFVCARPRVSFEEWIAPLAKLAGPYNFDQMRYQFIKRTVVPCNWKVAVEAFLESYHLYGTHPQAIVSSDDTSAVYETLGEHGRFVVPLAIPSKRLDVDEDMVLDQMIANMLAVQYVLPDQLERLKRIQSGAELLPEGMSLRELLVDMNVKRASQTGVDISAFDESQLFDNHEFHIFPNVVFSALPGEWFGFRFRPNGDDPHSCVFEVIDLRTPGPDHARPEPVDVAYSTDPEECLKAWGTILHQDFRNLEKLQKGLRSRGLDHITLAGYQEQLIVHFHQTIDSYLTGTSA